MNLEFRIFAKKRIAKGKRPGSSPGTLIFVGEQKVQKTRISMIDYTKTSIEEKNDVKVEECKRYFSKKSITWINVEGLHDTELIRELCSHYKIHPVTQEAIVNTQQRPKFEEMDDQMAITIKMMYYDEARNGILFEHVSFILGKNYLITFQEGGGDVFDPVRKRLRGGKGKIRSGAEYLTYALIDAIVDNYSIVMDKILEKMDDLEEKISNPTQKTLDSIRRLKRDIIFLRKNIAPVREVILAMERTDHELMPDDINIYLRDVYDQIVQVVDTIDTYRDILTGMMDSYLSSISNRINEVMKVLTIISTIFIPLTFIVGIYGMNFDNMPELRHPYGYFVIMGIMAILAIGMLIYFKRKKWF